MREWKFLVESPPPGIYSVEKIEFQMHEMECLAGGDVGVVDERICVSREGSMVEDGDGEGESS